MIKRLLFIFFLCSIQLTGIAQTVAVSLNGTIHCFGDSTDLLENVDIIVSNDTDTIARIKSDKNGLYKWSSDIRTNSVIKITIRRNYFIGEEIILNVNDVDVSAFFESSLIELRIDRNHTVLYELNKTHFVGGFNIDIMKHQLRRIDTFCIEFTHFRNAEEKIKISEKRIKKFKKLLKKAGFNLSNFTFNHKILDCNNSEDCRGRTEGEVISIGDNCD